MVTLATTLSYLAGAVGTAGSPHEPLHLLSLREGAATAARHRGGNAPGGGPGTPPKVRRDRPRSGRPARTAPPRALGPPPGHGHRAARHHGFLTATPHLEVAAVGRGEAGRSRRRAGRRGRLPGGSERQERAAHGCSLSPPPRNAAKPQVKASPAEERRRGAKRGLHRMLPSREAGGRLSFPPSQVGGARFSPTAVCVCVWGSCVSPSARGETKSSSQRVAESRAAPSRSPIPFSH